MGVGDRMLKICQSTAYVCKGVDQKVAISWLTGRQVGTAHGMALGCHDAASVRQPVCRERVRPFSILHPLARDPAQEAVHCEVAPGNEEFQSAVKRSVPLGWVFKAMPQHHPHVCVGLMRKALLEDEQVWRGCAGSSWGDTRPCRYCASAV